MQELKKTEKARNLEVAISMQLLLLKHKCPVSVFTYYVCSKSILSGHIHNVESKLQ